MATAQKILGQSKPAATTDTDLYTVPAATGTITAALFACNQGAGASLIRVWLAPAGAATSLEQYIYYDFSIPANQTFLITSGIGLATTDVVRVRSDTGDVSFNINGPEIT